ncbi:MAG: DUF349 domain-containing protein [Prevotellaceae bacterium]|jgi:hypothetical protein|nr:DUF349 domain-containing protein [Prevotellaceae bacterium]
MADEVQNPAPEEQFTAPQQAASEDTLVDIHEDAALHEEEMNEEHSTLKYIHLGEEELLDVFKKLLETQSIEVLRREAEALKSAFYKLVNQKQKIVQPTDDEQSQDVEEVVSEVEQQFKDLYNEYKRRRTDHAHQIEEQEAQNLVIKQGIIDELKALLEAQEDINHTFPAFRELQQRWRNTGAVPLQQSTDLWNTYQHYVELFYDYVKINNELRDLDFKKNLEAKTLLCEKAEKLILDPNIITAFNKLQKYHEEWRELGPVAHEFREHLWERFKIATAAVNKKHQEYFESQKEEQRKNLELKRQLCEKAEEIANADTKENKAWNEHSKAMEELQKMWRTVGFATKKENTRIFERFRAACDKFYVTKRDFYLQFKTDLQENLKKKIALCEQVESFVDSTDWGKTTEKFVNLQKQWKEAGAVPRKHSDALWQRFRSACDVFFTRKNEHFSGINSEYVENLRQKEAIVAEIEAYAPAENPEENLKALQDFQRRWTAIGFVAYKEKVRIQTIYRAAIDKQFKNLNISGNDKKLIHFKSRINDLKNADEKTAGRVIRSERDNLVRQLRQLDSDIALWENNIGFFAKSKNAEAMIAEVNRKIEKAKEERQLLSEKIKLIEK